MNKLTKSLAELDALADTLLKSQANESDLTPEDISENTPNEEVETSNEVAEENEEEKKEETKEEKKEEAKEEKEEAKEEKVEKSIKEEANDEISKSVETEEVKEVEPELEDLEKSIQEDFESNEDIKKSIDESEFLTAVTEVIAKSLAEVVFNLQDSSEKSSVSNDVLAKSIHASIGLNKSMKEELMLLKSQNAELKAQNEALVKSMEKGFEDITTMMTQKFEEISHQPASLQKSVRNISVNDRNFQKSIGGSEVGNNLSKSEVLNKLTGLMYSGNAMVTPSDIVSYESGAPLRPELVQLINQ